jgi:hypothetical protein
VGSILVPYNELAGAVHEDPAAVQAVVHQSATDAANGDPAERDRLIKQWNDAVSSLQAAKNSTEPVLSTPQNDLASRLQTMLADRSASVGQLETVQPQTTVTTDAGDSEAVESVQVKFDNNDLIGWLGTGLRILFKKTNHPWIAPPIGAETIADDAKIAVFGDWGTGLYGAPVITKTIERLPRCDVVLHLGDTYYSGAEDEITRRLVGDWPKRDGRTINRTLNGNHEMYSGGVGYFDALQSFFNQPASCFAMQSSKWLLVGLDTAYKDFALDQSQVDWLKRLIAGAGTRKVMLFSHHQPFSLLDDQGPNLQSALGDLLNAQRITAWFWGHEHRLVVYQPHPKWGVKGRCVGHGGFPSFRDTDIGGKGDIYQWIHVHKRPDDAPQAPEALVLDGPNFWVTAGPEQYSPNGYLFLELDGENAFETYRTPDNIAVSERWKI